MYGLVNWVFGYLWQIHETGQNPPNASGRVNGRYFLSTAAKLPHELSSIILMGGMAGGMAAYLNATSGSCLGTTTI